MNNQSLLFFVAILFWVGCAPSKLHYQVSDKGWAENQIEKQGQLLYSLYLIGDAGLSNDPNNPVLDGLKSRLSSSNSSQSGVIFLGNNIGPEGLHKKSSDHRAEDEARISTQLDVVQDFDGDLVFLPGNLDWDDRGKGGWKHVKRQEKYIQNKLDRGNVFLPSHGCPGPEVVELAPGLVMIIIDTQWWLHQFERGSGEKDGCDVRNPEELLVLFKDQLKKYRDKNIIVAAHHPLYSNGNYGGHFPAKDHLFPLTAKRKKAYLPLPIIGSVYPLYRKFLGRPQDIGHPVYQDMKNKLETALNEYQNVIYVAGHERNLQYTQKNNIHHIVSGAGSQQDHLKFDRSLAFGARQKGYSKIDYYDNGEVWLEFYVNDGEKETLAYSKFLFQKEVVKNEIRKDIPKTSYAGQFATVVPDSNLAASGFKRLFFGDLNRDIWTTPLKVPYLDIHYDKGGLTPIKKGGGMQTLSLRMKGGDGKQYSLRGIKKNATFLTGANLRGTLAQDAIYDGMAGSHPYASVVIPQLSDAAGVYHSNPTLVYLPKDPILGDYLEEFGGMFCLFEERPNKDMSGNPEFGNSDKVMNYLDAIEKMHTHHHHVVDEDYVVNAKLFDILIGDWDRHDDQWRWARFKEADRVLYRPIPRDRDQAFFEFDGLFMNIANRKWAVRKFQPFGDEIRDMSGQNFNGRYFDRAFLTEASREDWIQTAKQLQTNMTDQVIEEAIKGFPSEAFEITGEEIIATLKARRDNLLLFAEEYYEILARDVSITGTLKNDFFEVIRREDGTVEVSGYPKDQSKRTVTDRFYHRVFYKNETKEIRIYGLDGKDEYRVTGKSKKSIVVRIISGDKKDEIVDESRVSGLRKMTRIYETEGSNEMETSSEARVRTMDEVDAYDYDRKDFVNNILIPLASIGFNPNDGFYIGPGFKYVAHGFKKSPYKYYHQFLANYAFGSEGINIFYDFDYVDLFGKADFAGKLTINTPLVYPYYGAGNEAEEVGDDQALYRVRMDDYKFMPSLKFNSSSQAQTLKLGLNLQIVDVDAPPLVSVNDWELQRQDIVGASVDYVYNNKDSEVYPSRGIEFKAGASWNSSVNDDRINFVKLGSEVKFYLPLNFLRKQATLNFRSGIETNIGDYAFFQASFLNGFTNFRGIQRNRLSGRTSSFHNIDLRISLLKVKNYVAPFDVGILGHSDFARVWQDGESSNQWHRSFGGGVFLNILDSFVMVGSYSVSDIDELLLIGTKFFF